MSLLFIFDHVLPKIIQIELTKGRKKTGAFLSFHPLIIPGLSETLGVSRKRMSLCIFYKNRLNKTNDLCKNFPNLWVFWVFRKGEISWLNCQRTFSKWKSEEAQFIQEAAQRPNISFGCYGFSRVQIYHFWSPDTILIN